MEEVVFMYDRTSWGTFQLPDSCDHECAYVLTSGRRKGQLCGREAGFFIQSWWLCTSMFGTSYEIRGRNIPNLCIQYRVFRQRKSRKKETCPFPDSQGIRSDRRVPVLYGVWRQPFGKTSPSMSSYDLS